MRQFIAKFESQIQGTLSGFDRVLFRGSLRRLTHREGMPRLSGTSVRNTTGARSSVSEPAEAKEKRRRSSAA